MTNYAPRLPLKIDKIDGAYSLVKDLKILAQQNLKMLLLTEPGERIMLPSYGVGLKRRLFEISSPSLGDEIKSSILQKVRIYLPYISITNIEVQESSTNQNITEYALEIKIYYNILPIKENDLLTIQL
jgi:phage baseplate assembly protein W